MIEFVLNDQDIATDLQPGMTVLDFVRYNQDLKGTKIGCREGDCGACTILVGELTGENVRYRSMTSCLMPLANAAGKHIVTIEGINPPDGSLTPVQHAMVDESGTQCGFCTVGFVMSLTGFCVDDTKKTTEMAVSAIDGNICRCTGYKSIARAACSVSNMLSEPPASVGGRGFAIDKLLVPKYFGDMAARLRNLGQHSVDDDDDPVHPLTQAIPTRFVGGGTDIYVQKPDAMAETAARNLFYDETLRGIRDLGDVIEIGASTTVTDLLESPVMKSIFPDLYNHLKLVSSTPIRNMATLAGNFVNASPIGDMTVWFLALDAEIALSSSPYKGGADRQSADASRSLPLRSLYQGYKQLAKSGDELITALRFKKPGTGFRFNFEKVSKRTYLDIATVNTAISLYCTELPGPASAPEFIRSELPADQNADRVAHVVAYVIGEAHVAVGGVAPIPLYLKETSVFLKGKEVNTETIARANEIMQSEISPISDVRGTAEYKRLLLRQLFRAHFYEVFGM